MLGRQVTRRLRMRMRHRGRVTPVAVTWLERASQPEALLVEETDKGLFGLRDLSSS